MTTLRTQGYLPYPDGAEPVAGGDNAFAALATALDSGWKALTAGAGWGGMAGGIPFFRVRNGRGRLEFGGGGFYGGTIPTSGIHLLGTPNPAIAEAAANWGGTYMKIGVTLLAGTVQVGSMLQILNDGRVAVIPSASITNPVLVLEHISISSPCRVAP